MVENEDPATALWIEPAASTRCPTCGRVSHNPNDVRERYCGACHSYYDMQELIFELTAIDRAAPVLAKVAAQLEALRFRLTPWQHMWFHYWTRGQHRVADLAPAVVLDDGRGRGLFGFTAEATAECRGGWEWGDGGYRVAKRRRIVWHDLLVQRAAWRLGAPHVDPSQFLRIQP